MPKDVFVIAHVSDLHASTFGDTFHDGARMIRRSAKPRVVDPKKYEVVWEEAGWRVFHQRGKKAAAIILLDPQDYEHAIPTARKSGGVEDPVERAAKKACRVEARTARTLSKGLPSKGALEYLAESTPNNANVRLLRAARAIDPAEVDAVFITGDLTDDGDGYELVREAFRPWLERGMLFAVPGNHDLYLFPLFGSSRPRPTFESKRAGFRAFAAELGLVLEPSGLWHRYLPEPNIYLVGLDSCARTQPRFFRHNGGVGEAQLLALQEIAKRPEWSAARHRIVGLHHHVVPLPHGVGRRAPSEIGMRLDDAPRVAKVMDELKVDLVLHGHRHVSEERQPAGSRFRILASPSLTLGCRSGDGPSYWRISVGEHIRVERTYLSFAPIEDADDAVTPEIA